MKPSRIAETYGLDAIFSNAGFIFSILASNECIILSFFQT